MRKVRIINGTYGYRTEGALYVTPKTRLDEPFCLDDAEAARLVGLKVAAYVADEVATASAPPDEDGSGEHKGESLGVPEAPEYNAASSVSELRAIGKQVGLVFPVGMTKRQILDKLDYHFHFDPPDEIDLDADDEPDDEVLGDDSPPVVKVEGPVL